MKMNKSHRRPTIHVSILQDDEHVGTWTSTCSSSRTRSSYGGFESPLIAVPFNWEARPGVPKSKSLYPSPTLELDSQQRNTTAGGQSPLTPPPRLMRISSSTRSRFTDSKEHPHRSRNDLGSPRSPRSVWLSKKMKSLLQGKLHFKSNVAAGNEQTRSPVSSPGSLSWRSSEMEFQKATEQQKKQSDELYSASLAPSSSNDIVFEGDFLRSISGGSRNSRATHQPEGVSPFKNMSNMLLELWYGGSPPGSSSSSGVVPTSSLARETSGYVFNISPTSSSSSDLESPGSSTDNSLNSFSSDTSDQLQQLQAPRHDHEFKTSFDSFDDLEEKLLAAAGVDSKSTKSCRVQVGEYVTDDEEEVDDDDGDEYEDFGSMRFQYSSSSREFFAQKFYYKSDRFRVESCESASLLSSKRFDKLRDSPVTVQPRPSALKKQNAGVSKCLKKVRFAAEEVEVSFEVEDNNQFGCEEEEPEQTSPPSLNSPVLTRFSSRPASRYSGDEDAEAEVCSPSPRTKRDLSELLMQIIQADVEMNRKQRGPLKSMFRSRSRW